MTESGTDRAPEPPASGEEEIENAIDVAAVARTTRIGPFGKIDSAHAR